MKNRGDANATSVKRKATAIYRINSSACLLNSQMVWGWDFARSSRKGRFVMSTEKSIKSEVTVCDTVDDSVIDFLAKIFYPLVMAEINKKERTENE